MKTKRRAAIAAAAIAVGALMLVGMTIAYLTDSRTVNNILGFGTGGDGRQAVQLSLEEPSFAYHASEKEYLMSDPDAELLSATVMGLMPGDKIFKDPVISNSGTDSVYLRVRVDVSDEVFAILEGELGLTINPAFVEGGDGYWYFASGKTSTGGKALEFTSGRNIAFFECLYVIDAEGGTYFYSMEVPEEWTNADIAALTGHYQNGKVVIPVIAEAVQYEGLTVSVPWDMENEIGHDIYAVATEERSRPQE